MKHVKIQIFKCTFKKLIHFVLSVTSIGTILVSSPPAVAFEKLAKGQNAFIACKTVNAHTNPSTLSPISAVLNFGDKVTVRQLANIFELPDSDYQSRAKLKEANDRARKQGKTPKAIQKTDYTRAAWIKIGTQKFLPASCLVGKKLFNEQTLEIAKEKVIAVITKKAKRNFSEEEEGDLRAMRGAAGKAVGGKADFATIDKLIANAQGQVDSNVQKAFREAGRLGEFK